MTEHPDTITVAKCHPFRGDNFYITLPGSDRSGFEYIRADVHATRIADLERKLAEREAQVARLLEMQTEREVDHERQLAEAREVKPEHAETLAKEMQMIVAADRWKGRDLSAAPPEKWSHLRPETRQFWIDTAARILSALKGTP